MEGSVGAFLGEMNLDMKYQKTAILIIPVIVCPIPPCCCRCCPCPCCPPPGTAGGAILSFLSYSNGCRFVTLSSENEREERRCVDGFEVGQLMEIFLFLYCRG